VLNQD